MPTAKDEPPEVSMPTSQEYIEELAKAFLAEKDLGFEYDDLNEQGKQRASV